MARVAWAVVVAVGFGLAAGCGSSKPTPGPTPGAREALEDLGQGLKTLSGQGVRPPARLAEFESLEPLIPVAAPMIRDGSVVYLWGAGYAAGGDKVVAYEKKAESEGGSVLLQNGQVKEMSASEFAAAPKAKK